MNKWMISAVLLITGVVLYAERAGADPSETGLYSPWYISFRDAIYEQDLPLEAVEELYRKALAGAEDELDGQTKYLMFGRCEYLMGRACQDNENDREAGVHYDKGTVWAETAQEQGKTSEGWIILAQNIAQNCSVKSIPWAMANGLKVERYSKKALDLNSRNIKALYLIAARYAFGPRPFGNYPKGGRMMREILDAHESIMGKDDLFNVYSAIGYAHLQDKKYEEARPWLEKSLTYYPGNKFVRGLLNNRDG